MTPRTNHDAITTIQLGDVKRINFDSRPRCQALSNVNPGHYLEITPEKESTNQVKLNLTSTSQFVKKTLGTHVDPGYDVEVDLQDKIIDNYILAEKRLPPSFAKGHRWIRIEKRKIKSLRLNPSRTR
jgi:hypothetical protein